MHSYPKVEIYKVAFDLAFCVRYLKKETVTSIISNWEMFLTLNLVYQFSFKEIWQTNF